VRKLRAGGFSRASFSSMTIVFFFLKTEANSGFREINLVSRMTGFPIGEMRVISNEKLILRKVQFFRNHLVRNTGEISKQG
jgi:hypothetical protein